MALRGEPVPRTVIPPECHELLRRYVRNDKFLFGILIFIGLLVVTALVLFATGNATQDYLPDGSPEAAVHNYALALTRADYERAYSYLSEQDGKPTQVEFRTFFSSVEPIQNTGLRVEGADILGEEAVVDLSLVYAASGPFDTGFDRPDTAQLVLENGDWKIVYMPYPFWEFDWYGER